MRLILLFLLCAFSAFGETYTEFYCNAAVSANNTNVNAGSTTGVPVYGPSVNGNWDGTSVFTPTDGSTPASTVSAGMWASVYLDAATVAVYIALVTNVAAGANGAITIDRAAFAGTPPASGATGRSLRVGGCWKGPFGSVKFPFGTITGTATNGPGVVPRVNFLAGSDYTISATIAHNGVGPVVFQGYTNTVGDFGKARIIATGVSGTILNIQAAGTYTTIRDFEIATNSAGAANAGLTMNGAPGIIERVQVHDVGGAGILLGTTAYARGCEAYNCNKFGTANLGGMVGGTTFTIFENCRSHDNTGSVNCHGFCTANVLIRCISDHNSGNGFKDTFAAVPIIMVGCDSYSNTLAGLDLAVATIKQAEIRNCNFIQNGGAGITNSSVISYVGNLWNCGFGSGTATNVAGNWDARIPTFLNTNSLVIYPANATPWSDPANGNYKITLTQAKSAGFGRFPIASTIGYPDIGAAQSPSTNTPGSWTFSQ